MFLNKAARRIVDISGNGAYDAKDCYKAIRIKRAAAVLHSACDVILEILSWVVFMLVYYILTSLDMSFIPRKVRTNLVTRHM